MSKKIPLDPVSIPTKASDPKPVYKGKKNIKAIAIQRDSIRLSGDGVFYTIQGEGPTLGYPAVFVRLHHCNLACSWCLAAGTKVRMANYGYRNIEDIRPGEYVQASNGEAAIVQATSTVTKDEYYRIELMNGQVIECSGDHEFWVEDKWIKAKDLVNGATLTTTPDTSKVVPYGRQNRMSGMR